MIFRHLPISALTLALSLTLPLAAHGAEAMRVVRDAKTGELRGPTAVEAAAFAKAEAQMRAGRGKTAEAAAVAEIIHADGTVEVKLGEDTMLSSVATVGLDGSLSYACLPAKEARKFVKSGNKPAALKSAVKQAGHNHE